MNIVGSNTPSIGFCCERRSSGSRYTYTLTTRLADLLQEAQERFGPRDHEWTPIGIEFGGQNPSTWYPGIGNCKYVSIKLSANAANDPQRALFQLAHEVIHLLGPGPKKETLTIEEGVATFFSIEVAARFGFAFKYDAPAYDHAGERVTELLRIAPDAVKRLRAKRPSFASFTPEFIRSVLPAVSERLAVDLCEPFAELRGRLQGAGEGA
jgi:hypothetical protein